MSEDITTTEADVQDSGQTGQDSGKKDRPPFFEVAQDPETKKWHWMLWSTNGRPMATNAIEYDRKKDAIGAIARFKDQVALAKHVGEASE